jgi:membrane associated rhomboid family serine protease
MPQDVGFGFRFKRPTPVVGGMLVLLVAVWMASALVVRFGGREGAEVFDQLMLVPGHVLDRPWTLVTASLLHSLDDTGHLLMNGLVFYFFAPELEQRWGAGRFALFMLGAALVGHGFVLLAVFTHLSAATSVVGFSSVVMAVTIVWGLTNPDREMIFLFFPMRGIYLVYVTIGLQVLEAVSFSHVSAAGHFGGIAFGAIVASTQRGSLRRWWLQRRLEHLQSQARGLHGSEARVRRPGAPALRVIKGGGGEPPKDPRMLN